MHKKQDGLFVISLCMIIDDIDWKERNAGGHIYILCICIISRERERER